ncbi:MAG: glycosyltransferase family 4 protein [Pseudomonadota bacterium]|nr:glycosyltransferase family 4 protein [Pseudomonadota bacterium]
MSTPESKPPVILQVLPSMRSGGVERGTIEIARAIVKSGAKALVASAGGPMTKQLAYAGAEHIILPLARRDPLTIWRNISRIEKIIRDHKVDILHARSRGPAWSAWFAARRTGCHFITTFHGTYGLQNALKRKYNSIMTRGERVIAISDFIAAHIAKNYVMYPARLRTIHRGVDLNLFNPARTSLQRMIDLTREWHLPDDLPLVLFPGRLTAWKGQEVFLRALAALPHRHFFAMLLGDDKGHVAYRRKLEAMISSLGLEGHVRIAPHTQHIVEAYMLARVVVATSIEPEAFGRVVLEAQAMGKPVIATNHGGPQETVIPDVTGWLVPPGDVRYLSAAINHALSLEDETLQAISSQAIANAQRFSMEQMCQQTLEVYKEVLFGAGA